MEVSIQLHVSITFYKRKTSLHLLEQEAGCNQKPVWALEEEGNLLSQPAMASRLFGSPSHNLVAMPTVLSWLPVRFLKLYKSCYKYLQL